MKSCLLSKDVHCTCCSVNKSCPTLCNSHGLLSSAWLCAIYLDSWAEHSRFLCNTVLYIIRLYSHHQTHPQLSVIFTLAQPVHFGAIALCTSPVAYWTTSNLGMWGGGSQLLMSYLFAFSYSLWGSPGKNTGVGCYFFLKWTMFYQKSSKIKTT